MKWMAELTREAIESVQEALDEMIRLSDKLAEKRQTFEARLTGATESVEARLRAEHRATRAGDCSDKGSPRYSF